MTTSGIQTHSLGVQCSLCGEVIVPDDCVCGTPHGYGHQVPNGWAARQWPEHVCFYFSDEALEKQRLLDEYKARGEQPPMSLFRGFLEPRVHSTKEEDCVCCGSDARDPSTGPHLPGGELINGERYCFICIGRGHPE